MSQTQPDNRRTARESLRIPVKLESAPGAANDKPIFFGYTSDINGHGLKITLSSSIDEPSRDLLLNIDFPGSVTPLKVPVKLVWSSHMESGFEFKENVGLVLELLKRSTPAASMPGNNLKKFYPYVGDEDIDTGKYEYFPYTDKALTDPKKVREIYLQLKRGENHIDAESFFYAQYAIADSLLNIKAIDSAQKAFQIFKKFSIERRRKILDDIRELLIKEKEIIIGLMIMEGHPKKLAEWEYSGMLTAHLSDSLDYYQSELIKTVGKYGDETLISIRRPEGVICVCPPKNAACSNSLTASFALLAGNTLVIKPPLNAPVSTMYLWRNIVGKALKMNGAPNGTINIVVGNSSKFMEDWLSSAHVKSVIMFNDSAKGIEIGKKVFERGKKPILELSGNDYMLIWKDAPINEAADSLIDSFMGSTQICMVPKKAFIHSEIYAKFMSAFLQKVRDLKIGLPSDPDTILSPVVKISDFFAHLEDAIQNGGNMLTGGFRADHTGTPNERGMFISPTVVEIPLERANMMKCIREENFFPLLPVIKVTGGGITDNERDENIFNNMISALENNQYGLRISVWVKDQKFLRKFIEDCDQSGLLRINSRHIEFSKCLSTHGGIGKTGGPFGEMNYIWQKTSYLQGISITANTDKKSETFLEVASDTNVN